MGSHREDPLSVRTDSLRAESDDTESSAIEHAEVERLMGEKIAPKVSMVLLPDGRVLGRVSPSRWLPYTEEVALE
jgi:hypothetical protein